MPAAGRALGLNALPEHQPRQRPCGNLQFSLCKSNEGYMVALTEDPRDKRDRSLLEARDGERASKMGQGGGTAVSGVTEMRHPVPPNVTGQPKVSKSCLHRERLAFVLDHNQSFP